MFNECEYAGSLTTKWEPHRHLNYSSTHPQSATHRIIKEGTMSSASRSPLRQSFEVAQEPRISSVLTEEDEGGFLNGSSGRYWTRLYVAVVPSSQNF